MKPLHKQLRELADTLRVLPEDETMLIEAADRLELVEGLYEDQVEITRNWKLAADARWDRIKRLEEAGDFLCITMHRESKYLHGENFKASINVWRKAKEAKL